jgi:hypothetical protein
MLRLAQTKPRAPQDMRSSSAASAASDRRTGSDHWETQTTTEPCDGNGNQPLTVRIWVVVRLDKDKEENHARHFLLLSASLAEHTFYDAVRPPRAFDVSANLLVYKSLIRQSPHRRQAAAVATDALLAALLCPNFKPIKSLRITMPNGRFTKRRRLRPHQR